MIHALVVRDESDFDIAVFVDFIAFLNMVGIRLCTAVCRLFNDIMRPVGRRARPMISRCRQ